MATTYKVLGQSVSVANTAVHGYTVPTGGNAVVSTVNICNRSTTSDLTYRLAVLPSGETLADKHYIIYDAVLAAKDAIGFTYGITLAAGDKIVLIAPTADFSMTVFGQEITP
jgi:hypothetical protein